MTDAIDFNSLLSKWQKEGCKVSRDKAIIGTFDIIYYTAKKYQSFNNHPDLVAEGMLAAIQACDDYTIGGDATFQTFVGSRARYAILTYLRLDHTIPKGSKTMHNHNLAFKPVPESHSEIVALSEETGVTYAAAQHYAIMSSTGSVQEAESTVSEDSTYDLIEQSEKYDILLEKFAELDPRRQEILKSIIVDEKTLSEVSKEHGVTLQRIDQIFKKTVKDLRG